MAIDPVDPIGSQPAGGVPPEYSFILQQASAFASSPLSAAPAESNTLSPLAAAELEKQKQQEELQKKIQELVQQINEALERGDLETAQSLVQQLASLLQQNGLQSDSSFNLPGGAPNPAFPGGGNFPGIGGDAPVFAPGEKGGKSQPLPPEEVENLKKTLPGGGNEGVVNTALNIASKGLPYLWGGDGAYTNGRTRGYDCSGFTQEVFRENGINLPRTAQMQYDYLKGKGQVFSDPSGLKPGDLIFFNNPYDKKTTPIGHVGIYLGNGKYAAAQSSGVKVYDYNSYWKKYTVAFGRPGK